MSSQLLSSGLDNAYLLVSFPDVGALRVTLDGVTGVKGLGNVKEDLKGLLKRRQRVQPRQGQVKEDGHLTRRKDTLSLLIYRSQQVERRLVDNVAVGMHAAGVSGRYQILVHMVRVAGAGGIAQIP